MNNVFIQQFLEMLSAERGASNNTIEAYQHDLLDFCHFLHHQEKKRDSLKATTENIRAYLHHLYKKQFSETTRARKLSAIKQYYKFLALDEHIKHNPAETLSAPKQGKALPKYLAEDDVNHLLANIDLSEGGDAIRLKTLLEILYASGLRVTELVTLKFGYLQFESKKPHIQLKPYLIIKGKGRKERLVPLNENAIEALQTHLEYLGYNDKTAANRWIFPSRSKEGHLTRQRFGQMLKAHAIECGIDPKLVSPHILRHSFASHMLHHGIDLRILQELLGHSDISTTQIYTHILNQHMKKLVEEKHPLAQ
jgi:integrase/recombinase XerD